MRESAVLLFELSGSPYGAEVRTIRRIAEGDGVALLRNSALGHSEKATRGLVVEVDGVEQGFAVDRILGVLPAARVVALPPLAAACIPTGETCGLVESEGGMFPLVDLAALIRSAQRCEEADDE